MSPSTDQRTSTDSALQDFVTQFLHPIALMDPTPKMAAKGITNTADSTKGFWIPDYQKYLDHSDEIEETVNGIFAG
jgi:hypothetical protein